MTERKSTRYLVVHCSATRPSMDIGAREIRQWHKAKGWSDIGYHYVIRRDGRVEKGRPENTIGAHVSGHNANSIGVCLVGGVSDKDYTKAENNFTKEQFESLKSLLKTLSEKYPKATILGHRDFPKVAKACPSFDVRPWATKFGLPV